MPVDVELVATWPSHVPVSTRLTTYQYAPMTAPATTASRRADVATAGRATHAAASSNGKPIGAIA